MVAQRACAPGPETIRRGPTELLERTDAAELRLTTIAVEHADRLHSCALVQPSSWGVFHQPELETDSVYDELAVTEATAGDHRFERLARVGGA